MNTQNMMAASVFSVHPFSNTIHFFLVVVYTNECVVSKVTRKRERKKWMRENKQKSSLWKERKGMKWDVKERKNYMKIN